LGGCGKKIVGFLYRVFELPLLQNARKRDKTNRAKQTREKKKKRRKQKLTFFVMSPDGFFGERGFIAFLNSPCYKTPKNAKQNRRK
jgi:hypothetical protein